MTTPFETLVVFIVAIVLAAAVLSPFIYWRWVLEKGMRYVLRPVGKFIMANLLSVAILATIFIVPCVIIYWDVICSEMVIVIKEVIYTMAILLMAMLIISFEIIILIFIVGILNGNGSSDEKIKPERRGK
jgi:hypothetical protein